MHQDQFPRESWILEPIPRAERDQADGGINLDAMRHMRQM
jgi:hypothetical protein